MKMKNVAVAAATITIGALGPLTAQAQPASNPKRAVYAGNNNAKVSRQLTAKEKRSILAGKTFAPTTQIVCPPSVNMSKFKPNADFPGKDYGSFLAMRGGSFGYVTREWLNGCEQRLSFPVTDPKKNKPYGEAQGDYKPTYSPDGKHIAFFRRYAARAYRNHPYTRATDEAATAAWHTRTTVIDTDGGHLRSLSDDTQMNSNPMWTRKKFRDPKTGKRGYRVTWTKMIHPPEGESGLPGFPLPEGTDPSVIPTRMQGCWNDVRDVSNMRRERCWTDDYQFQFAYSSLADGRTLVRKELANDLYLVRPNDADGTQSRYRKLEFKAPAAAPSSSVFRHKISISDDETKIVYMLVDPAGPYEVAFGGYNNARLAYADFDAKTGTVSNEVIFTDVELKNTTWYPQFTDHNKQIIFACGGLCPVGDGRRKKNTAGSIYEYDLKSRRFTVISHHQTDNRVNAKSPFRQKGNEYRYPNVWGAVK